MSTKRTLDKAIKTCDFRYLAYESPLMDLKLLADRLVKEAPNVSVEKSDKYSNQIDGQYKKTMKEIEEINKDFQEQYKNAKRSADRIKGEAHADLFRIAGTKNK